MDILGIGPLELILILVIALIVLGPSDMVKAGRTIGKFLRQIVTSPTWHAVTKTSSELRNLPNKLIRDAGLEEDLKEIQDVAKKAIPPSVSQDLTKWQEDVNSWTTSPTIGNPPDELKQTEIDSSQDVETPAGDQETNQSTSIETQDVSRPEEARSPGAELQNNQEQAD